MDVQMLRRRDAIGALMMGAGAFLTGCSTLFPMRYRFRMTAEVETPQGLRSGSSVMEVRAAREPMPFAEGHAVSAGLIGEAVAVDIAPRQTMFVLLTNVKSGDMLVGAVTQAFEPKARLGDDFLAGVEKLGQRGQRGRTVVLPPALYPKLVLFRDMRVSTSVEEVDPNNLSASFGPNVQLRRITLQTTDDSVTHTLRSRLPWLSEYPEPVLNPSHGLQDWSLSTALHHGDFIRES
jgi:hypothetical protein